MIPRPNNKSIIGINWVFRNKLDKDGNVTRNKAILVAEGYSRKENTDYIETYAPVTRLAVTRILVAFTSTFQLHRNIRWM